MERRRLVGVAVLAAAVLALAVGAELGRPPLHGVAAAPPIDPPPQVGDCLYEAQGGAPGTGDRGTNWQISAFHHSFRPLW